MDLSSNKFMEPSSAALFPSDGCESMNGFCKTSLKNPFLDTFPDPLCKLNLKENTEFVKSFPEISGQRNVEKWAKKNAVEAPATPGRPIFSFSNGGFARKSVPSKWDDAEKWLVSGSSCHDSPANNNHGLFKSMESSRMFHKPHNGDEVFAEKSRVTDEKVSAFGGTIVLDHHTSARTINGASLSATAHVLLKDKFTDEVNTVSLKFGCSEPLQEGFLFDNSLKNSSTQAIPDMVNHRDIGTEMTPLGSSTTSRCPTPFMSTSPARHNTPANRSGPLAPDTNAIDMAQLQECHLAKLHLGTQFDTIPSNWSSREEEEEDVSKSLRHFEMNVECRKSVSESRYCGWEEEEKNKSCLRYQREQAKIEAWVNLQSAKAEAESRKLEVKIQKIRSNFEEKLMKRMADVNRKAEEWRASAQFQHSEQIRRVGKQAKKVMNRNKLQLQLSNHNSCGCFPCNNQM